MNKYRNRIYCILAIFITAIISSCSGGVCAPEKDSVDGQVLNIEMNAPSQYPAGKELYVPVLVTNTSNATLSNVVYSIPTSTNTTGSTISVTDDSQANCATLTSGQVCQLTIHIVPNGVVAKQNTAQHLQDVASAANNVGSFQVLAQNNQLHAEKAVYIGLVDVPPSTGVGADGIALLYNPTLISGNSCKVNSYTSALITMVVTSENVGQFNTLQIVDTNDNILAYEVLTGNSGEGMTSLTVGSVVTLAVEVPCGSTQLVFKPLLKSDNDEISNGEGQNQVIEVIPPTVNQASLSVLPSLVNLNESTPTQVITIVNNGNASATSLNITTGNHITREENTCGSNLSAGASCSYIVSFDASQPIVGTTTSNVSYNDNQADQNLNVVINYRGKTPFVGLTLSSNNFTYTFNATTESPIYASVVTITNAGEVLPLTLANLPTLQYFDISTTAGTANNCTANQVLQPGDSCNILVTYNNATASSGSAEMTIGYNYTDIDSTPQTGKTSVNLNYNTVQSLAVLSYGSFQQDSSRKLPNSSLLAGNSGSTYGFDGILNNGVDSNRQTITITNLGQVPATAVNVLSPDQPYSIISNRCGATIARGANCQVLVAFGPVGPNESAGTKVSNLLTNYLPYSTAATTTSISTKLTGNVYFANTAILNGAVTASTGFESGNGSVAQPYQIQRNNNGTVTYTLTNSGAAPANQFYVSYNANALLPWSVTSSNCGTQQNPTALAESGGSCSITFRPNTSSVGTSSLNFANIQMNWVDEDSPNGQTQLGTGMVYVNVFASPQISASITPSTISFQNATVTFTLSGGYNVESQLVGITGSTPNSGLVYPNGTTCKVSSISNSCSITVSQINNVVQSYTLSLSNYGNVPLTPGSLLLNISISWYSFGSPRQLAVKPNESGVFIANLNNNSVSYCDISGNNFVNCIDSLATGLSGPFGIVLESSGTYAYISNNQSNIITRCTVSGKYLINCTNSGANSIDTPFWLNLNNTQQYMFISNNYGSYPITQCTLNGGNLTSCGSSGANLSGDRMRQVTPNASGNYSFVSVYLDNKVETCNTSGSSLSNCVDSGATGLNGPIYLVLNKAGTYAFISNYNNSSIVQCSVSGGTLSNCSNTGATNLSGPEGLFLNAAGTYLYVTNVDNNTITRCSVSGNTVSNCVRTGAN